MSIVVQNKETLLSMLLKSKQKIRSYGVLKLSLFGSFAENMPNSESDVDLLVEFDANHKTYDNFMDLSYYLEDLLGRKVELVTPQSLSKYIGPYILKQAERVAI